MITRRAAVVVLVLIVIIGIVYGVALSSSGNLREQDEIYGLGTNRAPGSELSYTPLTIKNNGNFPVVLKSATLRGDPSPDLSVLGYSVLPWEIEAQTGAPQSDVIQGYPLDGAIPLEGYQLDPGEEVRLIVGVKTEKPDPMGFRGISISYQSGLFPKEAFYDYLLWICPIPEDETQNCDPEDQYQIG